MYRPPLHRHKSPRLTMKAALELVGRETAKDRRRHDVLSAQGHRAAPAGRGIGSRARATRTGATAPSFRQQRLNRRFHPAAAAALFSAGEPFSLNRNGR
jgi:hypothetical protein